ncbi:MAG: phosphoribosylaminoimidazolesuccinocarboxamide synthase [Candidatus Kapabacteria bacterium]|nr:phosphoribosylaminoimidazolesuccinocarboxamide synthase [Candidatus Kapabacteria bacterium]MCS7169115.1 phosphoribosylaminoimidazolesuccinocarboxamide synthase [Candidatus Kapabacteria bacterium]MDW8225865.1 phosphoribosylaminoimidazolesuccinocarboxamide synthase [Bacteroidota bacterium]
MQSQGFSIPTVTETQLPLPLLRRGKVRDLYEVDAERLLMVATDRISAFDVVLPQPVPCKGVLLTQLSAFWFEQTSPLVPNHLLSAEIPPELVGLSGFRESLHGRVLLVRRTQPIPIECIVRGYLAGSAWREYQQLQRVAGTPLPRGLRYGSLLPEPLFTPTTKAHANHDEPISFSTMVDQVGFELAERLRTLSLRVYTHAAHYCHQHGLILADTKLEFGIATDGSLLLIDELLTPDSSRFWLAEEYERGQVPVDMDKQFVRDYLEQLGWDKQPPAPELPAEVILQTRQRYCEAFRRLVPRPLPWCCSNDTL